MDIKIIPDKYEIQARIFPAIIVLIPFLIFTINCDISGLSHAFDDLLKVRIIGNLSIGLVLLFLLYQTNRFFGKFIFEKRSFNDELNMPTTRFLLFSDTQYSQNYKLRTRQKIKTDFKVDMPSEVDERTDLVESKRRIVEAVGLIRGKVKKGNLLHQYNIEFGFARNLIGGSIIGLLVSIFDIIYFLYKSFIFSWLSIFLTLFFIMLLLQHRSIINHLGNQYAKRLFQEYLQS